MLSSEAEVDSSCSKRPLLLCAWAGFQHSTGALILARNLEPACVLCFFFSLSPGWSSALPKGLLPMIGVHQRLLPQASGRPLDQKEK